MSTSTPVLPIGALIRVSSRASTPPNSDWRHAAAKPGASSARPSARAIDGAWESASTRPTCLPPRASSTASSIAIIERPGEPAGPQTAITRGPEGAALAASDTVAERTGGAPSRSASCQASTPSGSGGSRPNIAARRSSPGPAASGTMRTARRSQAATTAAFTVARDTSSTTASASVSAPPTSTDPRTRPSSSNPGLSPSTAAARADAATTASATTPSLSSPSARSLPCGSSTATMTLIETPRTSGPRRGPTDRPSRRASPRHPPAE